MGAEITKPEKEAYLNKIGGMFRCLYDKDWTLTKVSNGLYQLLEYTREEVQQHFDHKFLWMVDPRDRMELAEAFLDRIENGTEIGVELRLLCGTEHKWVWISGSLWPEDSTQFICMVYDQTKQRNALEALERQKQEVIKAREEAMRDSLTKTYNRAATERLICSYIEKNRGMAAFMVADVDNFKGVNDTLGHFYGDAVLSELAFGLKRMLAGRGFVGRLGGDEFILFMKDISCREEAEEWAEKAVKVLKRAFSQSLSQYEVTGSIGISIFPQDGRTFRELLTKADDAMYFAKTHGKNQCAVYNQKIEKERKELPVGERQLNAEKSTIKSFRDHIVEYVFRIFYENKNVDKAVPVLLDLIGKIFDVSRVYILEISEDKRWVINTFEWCNEGVTACIDKISQWGYKDMIPYTRTFDSQGIYECIDSHAISCSSEKKWFEERGTISLLQCRIDYEGHLAAAVGLEDCVRPRSYRSEAKETLALLAQTISLFLIRARQREILERDVAKQRDLEAELERYREKFGPL